LITIIFVFLLWGRVAGQASALLRRQRQRGQPLTRIEVEAR
jgi:hypothetical protein